MTDKTQGDPALAGTSGYRFPTHLVDAESEGPAFDAFRSYQKSNSASAFNEQNEGYPVMDQISDSFATVAGEAMASMKKPTSAK